MQVTISVCPLNTVLIAFAYIYLVPLFSAELLFLGRLNPSSAL